VEYEEFEKVDVLADIFVPYCKGCVRVLRARNVLHLV